MNARSQTDFNAAAKAFTSPPAFTLADHAREMAKEEFCKNAERFGSWLQCVGSKRVQSNHWGEISVPELLAAALKPDESPEQVYAAMRTIRRLYLDDCKVELAERGSELSNDDIGWAVV